MLFMSMPGLGKLPVIDRDESRFAVASVQMAESGDYVNIRFQDEARNKKPAGSYWAQTAMIKLFSGPGERRIWAQRLPSVIAALIAVLATYWAGIPMLGRRSAFIGAGLLAVSMLTVFEAHIAKTDAMLLACAALLLVSFSHLRQGASRFYALIFWAAMGVSIMVKGPVIPALALLTLTTLWIWERGETRLRWMGKLWFWPGPILCLLIVLPWSIMIWQATDGQFFRDALGGDFGSKVLSAQEKHGGPPGLYLLTLPIFFWPGSLLLFAGFVFAARVVKGGKGSDNPVVQAMRLALCFAVPFWFVLELVPTKLPNYLLPVYPAIALMAGGAMVTILSVKEFVWSRRLGALLFVTCGMAITVSLMLAESFFGPAAAWPYIMGGAAILSILVTGAAFAVNKSRLALTGAFLSSLILNPASYHFLLPSLTKLRLADRVEAEIHASGARLPRSGGPEVLAHNFTEPSLIYRLGKDVRLGNQIKLDQSTAPGTLIVSDILRPDSETFFNEFKQAGLCRAEFAKIEGFNYSRGEEVVLELSEVIPCPPDAVLPQGDGK
jgi:4-amino-4-deoxy-L-arabinose transferase-like glycosyltransferase